LALFLHRRGYTFFTIPQLTIGEIQTLVEAFSREQDEKEKAYKKASKKGKK